MQTEILSPKKLDISEDARAGRKAMLHIWASVSGLRPADRLVMVKLFVAASENDRELALSLCCLKSHFWHVGDEAGEQLVDGWFERYELVPHWCSLFQVAYLEERVLAELGTRTRFGKNWMECVLTAPLLRAKSGCAKRSRN